MNPRHLLGVSQVFIVLFATQSLAADLNDLKSKGSKALQTEGAKALKKFDAPTKMKNMEKKSRDVEPESASSDDRFDLGIGLQLGSGTTYGNGLITNLDFFNFLRAQIGAGYNSTGPKAGGGLAVVLPVGRSFGFDVGGAYGHSFGVKDDVSLDAKFTPEGGSKKESVEAIRKFRISPGNYYSVYAGTYYALFHSIWLDAHVVYNKYVNGHEVEFYDTVSFNQPIEATNEQSMQAEFDKKAREKLDATGLGFSLGVQFRI